MRLGLVAVLCCSAVKRGVWEEKSTEKTSYVCVFLGRIEPLEVEARGVECMFSSTSIIAFSRVWLLLSCRFNKVI